MSLVDEDGRPEIGWSILVYDRTAAEPLPFKSRWYRFNYDRATDLEIQHVLRLVSKNWNKDPMPLPELRPGDEHVTFELSSSTTSTSAQIIQYRHLFDFVPDAAQSFGGDEIGSSFTSVMLPPESYIEDENEQRMTWTQVFDREGQRKHGRSTPSIVYDHPESILRIIPPKPVRPELWSVRDADCMAQLFDIYRQLAESKWLQSRCAVSSSSDGQCEATLPVEEECRAVILPFRQLYSKDPMDDIFNRCCKIHNRHCPATHATFEWVATYRSRFNAALDSNSGFPRLQNSVPARRHLDAFAYGAHMIHASNKKEMPVLDLERLLESNPREWVVLVYHQILRTLLGYVSMTIPIFKQNVQFWENESGWSTPQQPGAQDLFD